MEKLVGGQVYVKGWVSLQEYAASSDLCFVFRARFESLCLSLFHRSLTAIDRVLTKSNITKYNVDQVNLYFSLVAYQGC